jgi:hypothetical protein
MSPNGADVPEFGLSDNIKRILGVLRTADLAWMADEIEQATLDQWVAYREFRMSDEAREFLSVIPERYWDNSEFAALAILWDYFIEANDLWSAAHKQLVDALNDPALEVALELPGSDRAEMIFHPQYRENSRVFRRLLVEAMPELAAEGTS